MLKYVDSTKMGRGQHGWLDSHFHFSFAEYHNPRNIQFGVLRVLNDDIVQPGTGFETHPHKNMEIISYVVQGELSHKDSMGNQHTLARGQVQYMSAGTGVLHSEHNWGSGPLRFIQMWILPDKNGYDPAYGDHRFQWEDRVDAWLPIATGYEGAGGADGTAASTAAPAAAASTAAAASAPIKIHADVNVFAAFLPQGNTIDLKVAQGRQAYLVLLEGQATVNNIKLNMRDALEITQEDVTITATQDSHLYAIEMQHPQS